MHVHVCVCACSVVALFTLPSLAFSPFLPSHPSSLPPLPSPPLPPPQYSMVGTMKGQLQPLDSDPTPTEEPKAAAASKPSR